MNFYISWQHALLLGGDDGFILSYFQPKLQPNYYQKHSSISFFMLRPAIVVTHKIVE
ncbi:hypothetical protein Sez_1011 [Streptococcus equi subsp. zooepidemicus MGCS10565]|uniref:Uncharacterized protein n=1 Tax=Streptococcus equi subsp. zooepidemicus (strain MGCS10565) TaxID=552526 RepID=B4U2Z8_STREM|nr:hypothetical protein Sez_1011 [Streptococcus equi subsp. zooepidemicus MGCS10565]